MKNSIIKLKLVSILMLTTISLCAQFPDWNTAGNNLSGGEWFGADGTSSIPLEIRHDGDEPILLSTDMEGIRVAEWGNVSIGGAASPTAKLDVKIYNGNEAQAPNFESTAIFAFNRYQAPIDSDLINRGIRSWSIQSNVGEGSPYFYGTNFGGTFWAKSAYLNTGVVAVVGPTEMPGGGENLIGGQGYGVFAMARDNRFVNVGVEARAEAHTNTLSAWTVGVLAGAGPVTATNDWAGWFDGDVYLSGALAPSDAMLKDNIEDLEGALDILNEIEPKTYVYQTGEYEFMNLPTGLQYGVVAQDLAEVLPELTRFASRPALLDSTGNETTPAIDFMTVNYTGLIPILVAGMKEQQAIIEAQNEALGNVMDQLDDLQQQINNCCSGGEGFKNHNPRENEEQPIQKSTSPNGNILNQNTPNPFRSQTTISYALEQGGKVILNVYDKNGKVLETLSETEQQPGTYRYEWDASGLPAGLYHYALYVDGELMVKKAIKLQD